MDVQKIQDSPATHYIVLFAPKRVNSTGLLVKSMDVFWLVSWLLTKQPVGLCSLAQCQIIMLVILDNHKTATSRQSESFDVNRHPGHTN
jgi:hypothetical protein